MGEILELKLPIPSEKNRNGSGAQSLSLGHDIKSLAQALNGTIVYLPLDLVIFLWFIQVNMVKIPYIWAIYYKSLT